jgi:hypothetical protein
MRQRRVLEEGPCPYLVEPIDYGDVRKVESERPSALPYVAAEAGWGTGMQVEGKCSASAVEGG